MADQVALSDSRSGAPFVPEALTSPSSGKWVSGVRLAALLAYVAAAYLIFMGWVNRDEAFPVGMTPLHYLLGLFAGILMLSLLYYPLWKVIGGERWKGAMRWWFRAHIVFGALAPAAVLYHAGFQAGSAQSQFAVALVFLVFLSGLVGRLIYARTYSSISGDKATLESLGRDKAYAKYKLATVCEFASRLRSSLQAYEIAALSPSRGLFDSLCRLSSFGIWTTWHEAAYRRQLNEEIAYEAHARRWSANQRKSVKAEAHKYLDLYLSSVRKMGGLSFYDNLFSLWYAIHLPLLMMMVAAAVFHVLGA